MPAVRRTTVLLIILVTSLTVGTGMLALALVLVVALIVRSAERSDVVAGGANVAGIDVTSSGTAAVLGQGPQLPQLPSADPTAARRD
jgi:hypothetical protein